MKRDSPILEALDKNLNIFLNFSILNIIFLNTQKCFNLLSKILQLPAVFSIFLKSTDTSTENRVQLVPC
jgi:hypothetical protein